MDDKFDACAQGWNSRISQYIVPPMSSPKRPDFQLPGQHRVFKDDWKMYTVYRMQLSAMSYGLICDILACGVVHGIWYSGSALTVLIWMSWYNIEWVDAMLNISMKRSHCSITAFQVKMCFNFHAAPQCSNIAWVCSVATQRNCGVVWTDLKEAVSDLEKSLGPATL